MLQDLVMPKLQRVLFARCCARQQATGQLPALHACICLPVGQGGVPAASAGTPPPPTAALRVAKLLVALLVTLSLLLADLVVLVVLDNTN